MVEGRLDVSPWDPFYNLFSKSSFNFAIFQGSENVPEEIDRLYSVANNDAPSFRKIP